VKIVHAVRVGARKSSRQKEKLAGVDKMLLLAQRQFPLQDRGMKEKTGNVRAESLEEIKAFLGDAATGYSEAQLPQLYRDIFAMAEILLDLYLARKRGKSSRERHDLTDAVPELTLK
jgi:hypothetical protein